MNKSTHMIGLVFITEDASVFRQAQSIATEPSDTEPIQIRDEVAMIVVDECWDLRHEEALADVMQIVVKAKRLNAGTMVYVIYGGSEEELKKAHMPTVMM